MFRKVIKIIDRYLDRNRHEDPFLINYEKAEQIIKPVKDKYQDYFELYESSFDLPEFESKSLDNITKEDLVKIGFNAVKEILRPFGNPIYRKFYIEVFKLQVDHYEECFIFPNPLIDNFLYKNLSYIFLQIIRDQKSDFRKTLKVLQKENKEDRSFFEAFQSINWINEDIISLKTFPNNVPLNKFIQKINFSYDKILKAEEKEFRKYIYDMCLKFADIIEGDVKTILQFFLVLDLANDPNITRDEIMDYSIGKILYLYNSKKQYKYLYKLKLYRNGNHHRNVKIIYNINNVAKSQFIFKDKYDSLEVSFENLMEDFMRIFKLVISFNFLISFNYTKVKNNGKNPFQIRYEELKQKFKEWGDNDLFQEMDNR